MPPTAAPASPMPSTIPGRMHRARSWSTGTALVLLPVLGAAVSTVLAATLHVAHLIGRDPQPAEHRAVVAVLGLSGVVLPLMAAVVVGGLRLPRTALSVALALGIGLVAWGIVELGVVGLQESSPQAGGLAGDPAHPGSAAPASLLVPLAPGWWALDALVVVALLVAGRRAVAARR